MIAITGATGQLGHYVIESLKKTVPVSQIVAIVRNPAKAQALAAQGITVRQADYGDEAALTSALQGVEKLLLISSSEVGQRAPQHRNVINAAKAAGVKFIAYTSLLHADTSPLGLADEHIETEKMLADSGIVYTLLRNGWYSENYLASAPAVILGPLIVFETLAGLLYTFLLRQQMPPLMTLSGIALLVIGVVIAVRAKPEKPLTESVSES